ncbi:MAG TPA: sugar ABC transporter permease [Clostridiaceae bacterium]|nr:sugar ABC transporter permease [Clostridiaceae bacterium]
MKQLTMAEIDQREDRKARRRSKRFPFMLMSPFFVLTGIFVIVPILIIFVMSFTDMGLTLEWNFIGFETYTRLFADPALKTILLRTFLFVVLATICSVLSSIFITVITTFYLDVIYRKENAGIIFRIIWLLPSLTPSVVYAFIWNYVFGPTDYHLMNIVRSWFDLEPITWFALYPQQILFLAVVITSASSSIILFSAAVRQIPPHIIQAAQVDGATPLYICRKIVLPYLRWPITQKTLWSVLIYFCTYEIIFLLTKGGPAGKTTTFAYYVYQNAFNLKKFGMGAALAVVLVAMSAILGLLVLRAFKVNEQLQEPRMDI